MLGPGDESITPPYGFADPLQVWIVDIRRRRVYLERISVDDFSVLGRRYRLSDDTVVTHLRGMPRYYCIRDKILWLWPVPAHAWHGAIQKE